MYEVLKREILTTNTIHTLFTLFISHSSFKKSLPIPPRNAKIPLKQNVYPAGTALPPCLYYDFIFQIIHFRFPALHLTIIKGRKLYRFRYCLLMELPVFHTKSEFYAEVGFMNETHFCMRTTWNP